MLDTVNLLTFPSLSSSGLSRYKSTLNASDSFGSHRVSTSSRSSSSDSDSPPRKTLRLSEVDGPTTRSKGKGKADETAFDDGEYKRSFRKLVVVNPAENDIPEQYTDKLKRQVLEHIGQTLKWTVGKEESNRYSQSFESIYQATRTLVVISGLGRWIFDKLKMGLNNTAAVICRHLLSEEKTAIDWLKELLAASNWYKQRVKHLTSVLTYLDRIFLLRQSDLPSITELSKYHFDAHVFRSGDICIRFLEGIRSWVTWERSARDASLERHIIKQLCETLAEYNLFASLFLDPYLAETRQCYEKESQILSESKYKDNPSEFLAYCAGRLKEEEMRAMHVLERFEWCWADISSAAEESLMKSRLKWLSGGLEAGIARRSTSGLRRLYDLFSRVDGLRLLSDTFKRDIQKAVSAIILDTERDEEMVDRLLELKGFVDGTLPCIHIRLAEVEDEDKPLDHKTPPSGSAPPNRDFFSASSDGFQAGFRGRKNKPAEMIAKYLDREMRKGQQGKSDEEFDKLLTNVLGLYQYTQDKDVFRTFYHKALSRRLLAQRSASDDVEKAVLKKLKEQYDPEFSMGDQMFRDLALSRDILQEYHQKPSSEGSAQNLSVMVLQRSFWPFAARLKGDILLPPNMQEDLSRYTLFYKSAHQGHKLDFDHSLGTVQMRGRFTASPKELTVSLYQAVILLLFNDEDEISYETIKEATQLYDDDLKRTLQSLACGKKKVIKKQPVGKDVNDTDVFHFNSDFTDPKAKVHINSIQVKETLEESKRTQTAVESDRKHYLDAAIVRIMKAKKNMMHQPLITATVDAVKKHFAPDVRMIKERIEQLIEQEYMRRDDEVDNMYVYVA